MSKRSKILIDKSGTEQSGTDPKDILKRVKDINLKPEPTLKSFLQPIEPNLRRTEAIQKKQLPFDAEGARLDLNRKIIETLQELKLTESKLTTEQQSEVDEFLENLPDAKSFDIAKAFAEGNFSKGLKSVVSKFKSSASKKKKDVKVKNVKTKKKNAEDRVKLNKRLKKAEEAVKKNKAKQKTTTEKGKKKAT